MFDVFYWHRLSIFSNSRAFYSTGMSYLYHCALIHHELTLILELLGFWVKLFLGNIVYYLKGFSWAGHFLWRTAECNHVVCSCFHTHLQNWYLYCSWWSFSWVICGSISTAVSVGDAFISLTSGLASCNIFHSVKTLDNCSNTQHLYSWPSGSGSWYMSGYVQPIIAWYLFWYP